MASRHEAELQLVQRASEIGLDWWRQGTAVGWDSPIDIGLPRSYWLPRRGVLSGEIRLAGPYRVTFRGAMAQKQPPRLMPPSGRYLLMTFRHHELTPPREMTVVILDELNPQEQQRWQRRLVYDPPEPLLHTWLITHFRHHEMRSPSERKAAREQILTEWPEVARDLAATAYLYGLRPEDAYLQFRRGDAYGWRPAYANQHSLPEDIMAQGLFYCYLEEWMPWEMVGPWFQEWLRRYKRRGYEISDLLQRKRRLALPLQANAVRPSAPALVVPDSLSVPQAAKRLGILPRTLRDWAKQGRITIEHRKAWGPGGWRVPITEVERLEADPEFQNKIKHERFMTKGQLCGLSRKALRQRISRGPQMPDGRPDWDALDAGIERTATRRQGSADGAAGPGEPALSREALEEQLAELKEQIREAKTEDERLDLIDKQNAVEKMLKHQKSQAER